MANTSSSSPGVVFRQPVVGARGVDQVRTRLCVDVDLFVDSCATADDVSALQQYLCNQLRVGLEGVNDQGLRYAAVMVGEDCCHPRLAVVPKTPTEAGNGGLWSAAGADRCRPLNHCAVCGKDF